LPPKLLARHDLLARPLGLLGTQEAGAGLPSHPPRQTVIRAVPGLGVLRASTTRLAAFHVTLGEGAAPHGLGVTQLSGKLTDRTGNFQRLSHGSSLRLL